jgi:hypothetical protein
MSNFESRVKERWTTYDNELVQDETIFENPTQKLCYMYLYSYAKAKKIFPSYDTIAVALCASRSTAIKVIGELEKMTLIEVKRQAGKSNNYFLNDYFEVAEKLTSVDSTPVKKSYSETDEKQDKRTRVDSTPVQNPHGTSVESTLLPVQNPHPITKTTKITKENKKLVSSSSEEIHLHDLTLKKTFAEVSEDAFGSVKAKLFKDAEEGKVKMKSVDQYFALMAKRLEFYMESQSKRTETAQIEAKEVEPSNLSPEPLETNLGESEKSESIPKSSEEVPKEGSEEAKKAIVENLKAIVEGGAITQSERDEKRKEIERMLDKLREDKLAKSKKPSN